MLILTAYFHPRAPQPAVPDSDIGLCAYHANSGQRYGCDELELLVFPRVSYLTEDVYEDLLWVQWMLKIQIAKDDCQTMKQDLNGGMPAHTFESESGLIADVD